MIKYKVITEKDLTSTDTEAFPKYLLGDTLIDAEETFACFEKYINNLATSYHFITGIDKSEFFGDAVIALGKARRDFDIKRSNNFIAYAKFLIVDSMNECIRNNITIVKIPSYIYKAHRIIARIKLLAVNNCANITDVLYSDDYLVSESVKLKINEDKNKLKRAAERANLPYRELIKRAEYLPLTLSKEDGMKNLIHSNKTHDAMLAKIVVDTINPLLDKDEKSIAEMLMQDLPRSEISKKLGRSDDWILSRMDKIKNKITGKFLK